MGSKIFTILIGSPIYYEKNTKSIARLLIIYVFAQAVGLYLHFMNLFVNDIPVKILKPGEKPDPGDISHTIDAKTELITKAGLINHVWVKRASLPDLDVIFDLTNSRVPTHLLSLVVQVEDYESVKLYLKKKFKVVKAAGGLVRKKDKFLMIYRLKKWIFPKGKKKAVRTINRRPRVR